MTEMEGRGRVLKCLEGFRFLAAERGQEKKGKSNLKRGGGRRRESKIEEFPGLSREGRGEKETKKKGGGGGRGNRHWCSCPKLLIGDSEKEPAGTKAEQREPPFGGGGGGGGFFFSPRVGGVGVRVSPTPQAMGGLWGGGFFCFVGGLFTPPVGRNGEWLGGEKEGLWCNPNLPLNKGKRPQGTRNVYGNSRWA